MKQATKTRILQDLLHYLSTERTYEPYRQQLGEKSKKVATKTGKHQKLNYS